MIFEINGAGFVNKGAQLMLETVVHELPRRLKEVEFVVNPAVGSKGERTSLGIKQLFPTRLRSFARFLPKELRDFYGWVANEEVDGLIDISGFAFSDQWGPLSSQRFLQLARFYASRGKPVIMLSQAFGPFKNKEVRGVFTKVLEYVDLAFARDEMSYEYVKEVTPHPQRLHLAPDITFFYGGGEVGLVGGKANYCCVVPNVRMLDQGRSQWGAKYLDLMRQTIKNVLDAGLNVYVLLHSTEKGDLSLANGLSEFFPRKKVKVVAEDNPLVLKKIIGGSRFVVGSRYHSLVAAFSTGVPSICMGWSHKYDMLYKDFGVGDFVVSAENGGDVEKKIRLLLEEKNNSAYRRKIKKVLNKMRIENEKMWNLTVDCLVQSSE